jgi:hypothetical protein
MNLIGNIVLPGGIVIGLTFGFPGSISFHSPFTVARFFPIHNSIFIPLKLIVTFCSFASHPTFAPNASATYLIGSSVLHSRIIGATSIVLISSLT